MALDRFGRLTRWVRVRKPIGPVHEGRTYAGWDYITLRASGCIPEDLPAIAAQNGWELEPEDPLVPVSPVS